MSIPAREVVPAAVDGLLTLWRAAFADHDPPVQVLDGDPVTWLDGSYVTVGMGGDDEVSEALSERPGLGRRRSDAVDLANGVWAAGGDPDMKLYRDRASGLFRIARDAVRDDQTLGGAVTRAEVVSYVYRPQRGPKGCGVAFEFTVRALTL